MKLSVVTSLYRSEPYIEEFHRRIRAAAAEITGDCEFIYVNDGSPDRSLQVALRLKQKDDQVVVVDLSRNFGHHRALMVGLSFATGDLVFMIDVDLEEEPELLRPFYARFLETEADSVYGVQSQRKGRAFERISGELFYRFLKFLSGVEVPANSLIARLMTRREVRLNDCRRSQDRRLPALRRRRSRRSTLSHPPTTKYYKSQVPDNGPKYLV